MPRAIIAPGEHYHIFNRGINKSDIFFTKSDYARMIFYFLFFQARSPMYNASIPVKNFVDKGYFNISKSKMAELISAREVELCAFAIMPNHFHLLVHEIREGGISFYLQRIENAYTRYFNTLRRRTGYLFQGPFQSVHVKNNAHLLYLSAYIHKNPIELSSGRGSEHKYSWSSYQDYLDKNRWGDFLKSDIILNQFKSPKEYRKFTDTSGAKDFAKADIR